VSDEQIQSQAAPADTGATETGTVDTTSTTDVSASTDAQQGAAPPADGTTGDASGTASTAEVANETPEAKTRRERQREARKAPAPPPQPTPEQIIAEYRRQQAEEQRVEAEQRARMERNAKWLGEMPVDHNGERITEYERLRREALRPVEPGTTYEDLERHNATVARYNELTERRQLLATEVDPIRQSATQDAQAKALGWMGTQFERGLSETGLDVQSVLSAANGLPQDDRMPAIVKAMASQYEAKYAPRISELEEQHETDQSEIDSLRRQLGGQAPRGMRGGMAANGVGKLTLKDLMSQPDYAERAMRGEFAKLDLNS
jgi:hypothetical protein